MAEGVDLEDRIWRVLLRVVAVAVLGFLILPIVIIVPISFTDGSLLVMPMPGLSTKWYASLVETDAWTGALANSLFIGTFATLLALVLGTACAIGLARMDFRGKAVVLALILSPILLPVVITAVATYLFFADIGLVNTYPGLILAHAALGVPFVVITVHAALKGFDMTLLRAAAGLGAPPLTAFRRVMLPIILPGVASGGLFAFVTSFDEIVVTLFLAGPDQRTIPRQIYSGVREYVSPGIAAVATLLIVFSTLLLLTVQWLERRAARLSGKSKA